MSGLTAAQSKRARKRWKKAIRLTKLKLHVSNYFTAPIEKRSLRKRLSKKLFGVRTAQKIDEDEENALSDMLHKFNIRTQQQQSNETEAVSEIEQESEWAQQACILHHQSQIRTIWDYSMFVLISYLMMSIPYEVAFVEPTNEQTFWSVLGVFIDILFWVDIVLTFNTSYKDGQNFVTDRKKIAKRYLMCWFWIDLCAALPLDDIITVMVVGDVSDAKALKMVKSVRLLRQLRMLKLLRLMRIARLLRSKTKISYAVSKSMYFIKIGKLVAVVLLLAHFMACIWYSITDTDRPDGGFLAREYFENPDTIYLRTLYHTIAMLISDQGGVEPLTEADFIFCSLCMILGAVAISVVFGQMALIISNMNAQKSVFQKKMEKIHTSMKYMNLPSSLRQRVFQYYRTLWGKHRSLNGNLGWFIPELSTNLKEEVTLCLRKNVFEKTFRGCQEKEMLELVMSMKRLFFLAGDIILKSDGFSGLFVIHSGKVQHVSKILGSGEVFEQGPAVAKEECEILWLPMSEVHRIARKFPGFRRRTAVVPL